MQAPRYGRSTRMVAAATALSVGATLLTGVPAASAQGTDTGNTDTEKSGTASLESITGSVSNDGTDDSQGSLDNPVVQAGGLILLGLAVSAALAISAGIRGGAFANGIPGLPPA